MEEARLRYESARRRRQREEPRLLEALRELQLEEEAATMQLQRAEQGAGGLQHVAGAQASGAAAGSA